MDSWCTGMGSLNFSTIILFLYSVFSPLKKSFLLVIFSALLSLYLSQKLSFFFLNKRILPPIKFSFLAQFSSFHFRSKTEPDSAVSALLEVRTSTVSMCIMRFSALCLQNLIFLFLFLLCYVLFSLDLTGQKIAGLHCFNY